MIGKNIKFKAAGVITAVVMAFSSVPSFALAQKDEKTLYYEDFNTISLSAAEKMLSVKEGDVTDELLPDAGEGKSLHLANNADTGSNIAYLVSFGDTGGGLDVSFSMKTNKTDNGWTSMYLGSYVNLYLSGLTLGAHEGARQPGYGTVDFGEWNDIQLKINIPENKYDLYLNYECIGRDLPFRNPTDTIRSIEFQLGNKSDLWIDNIKISSYGVNKKEVQTAATKPVQEENTEQALPSIPENAVAAEEDTFITSEFFGGTYGSLNELEIAGGYTKPKSAYLKFPGVSLKEGERAYVKLFLKAASGSGYLSLYTCPDNWSEETLSMQNAPKLKFAAAKTFASKENVRSWVSLDITDVCDGKPMSFCIICDTAVTDNASPAFYFASKETEAKPYIEIAAAHGKNILKTGKTADLRPLGAIPEKLNILGLGDSDGGAVRNFAAALAEKYGADITFWDKALPGITPKSCADNLNKLVYNDAPNLVVADFSELYSDDVTALLDKIKGINGNAKIIAATDNEIYPLPQDVLCIERSALFGEVVADIQSTAYISGSLNDYKQPVSIVKPSRNIVLNENFDGCSGSEIGNGWVIEAPADYVYTRDDGNGKYMQLLKRNTAGSIAVKKFFEPSGGSIRLDFQLAVFQKDSFLNIDVYPTARRDGTKLSSMRVSDGKLLILNNGSFSELLDAELGKWYNVSLFYEFDTKKVTIMADGQILARNIDMLTPLGTMASVEFDVAAGNTVNIGIDNVIVSHMEECELPQSAEEESGESEQEYLLDDNFDSYNPGTLEAGSAGNITYAKVDGNMVAKAERTSANGSCTHVFKFSPSKRDVIVDLDVYLGDTTHSTKVIYLMTKGEYSIPLYFESDSLYLLKGGERILIKKGFNEQQWYHLTLTTNVSSGNASLEIDGDLVSDAVQILGAVSSFDSFRFAITAGSSTYFYIDNLVIKQNFGAAGDKQYTGYNPDNDAPYLSDYTLKYNKAPSGILFEAEDMTLENYTAENNLKAHNGKGIRVAKGGAGIASFIFNGSSGYYGINIGYYEGDGAYDSYYYLYKNGELIDWWLGQYDDAATHIRKAKEYFYVENGDNFVLKGVYGKDPSSVDYIEFVPGIERDFKTGELISEENFLPDYWRSSSWDAYEDGGFVNRGLLISDVVSGKSTRAVRRFYPAGGVINLDMCLKQVAKSDYSVIIKSGSETPVSISFSGNSAAADGKSFVPFNCIGENIKLNVRVDCDRKKYTVMINGRPVGGETDFLCDSKKIDSLEIVTSSEGTALVNVTNVLMTAGYEFYENFRSYTDGQVPGGFKIGGTAVVKTMKSQGSDYMSLALQPKSSVSTEINGTKQTATFEAMLLIKQKQDGVSLLLNDNIGFYTKNGNIYCKSGGVEKLIWSNYKNNVWYEFKIVVNADTGKCDFYVNGFESVTDIPLPGDFDGIGKIQCVNGGSAEVWFDDIAVSRGRYECDVPEINTPQMKADYTVGMLACDIWHEGHHFGYDRLAPFDNRIPFLGYFEDGNPEVCDWETKYMAEHGINLWLPCWYSPNNCGNEPIKNPRNGLRLEKGFLNSKYQNMIDFAIVVTVIENVNTPEDFYEYYLKYWIERYFRHPSYWRIDGKIVIPIHCASSFSARFGDKVKDLFDGVDKILADEGLGGAIFIAVTKTANAADGYLYKTNYSVGATDKGSTAIDMLLNEQSENIGYIANQSQGLGNESWGLENRKLNVPLNEWKASLEWMRDMYMPSMKNDKVLQSTIILDNWNELSEGHTVAPSNLSGFGYLDMIREVFTNGTRSDHDDIVPDKKYDTLTPILW